MNYGFWSQLERPFFVLAPMANVTDSVFRQMIAKYSRPHAMWTEFVSCDGLCSSGRERLLADLRYADSERPLVAQVFGANPETFYETAKLIVELGFDGVDINMGCPDRAVVKQGAGASLIRKPDLAKRIIQATQAGVRDAGSKIPVSVKTRIGFSTNDMDTWIPKLLTMELPLLTVHVRTKKELSDVPAHWNYLRGIVDMARGTGTLIVGNGDVRSIEHAQNLVRDTGVDGVMLGRAVFGNPWLFRSSNDRPELSEVLRVLAEHTDLFESTWGNTKPFDLMKKHYKAYVSDFRGAHALRARLMACKNASEVSREIELFLASITLSDRTS